MVTARVYRKGVLAEEAFDPALVSDFLQEPDTLVWLDLEAPSDADLAMIEEEFSVHPLALEDARHRNQRPKLERYEGFDFLVLYGISVQDEELIEREIHVFTGPRFLVTLRFPPSFDLAPVLERPGRHPALVREGGGFLLHTVLDAVVDGYFDVVDRLEDESEKLEELVFGEEPPQDVQERIFNLRKRVMAFRRRVSPLREVLELVQADQRLVTPPLEVYYRDVADHVIRALEFMDHVRDLLTSALEAHLVRVSNRLNEVVKAITSWGAIILVPTLIAGIYGMNFRYMPELSWVWGYPFALALMAVSGGALYALFKRRGWL